MGLNDFETEGPRTFTPESAKQVTFGGRIVDEFEEEWGMTSVEAEEDDEFMAERIREADSVSEILDMFHWIEHTLVSKCAELVDEGVLEISDVPEVNHPSYNDHEIEYYIEHRINNKPLTSTPEDETTSVDENSALSAFRS